MKDKKVYIHLGTPVLKDIEPIENRALPPSINKPWGGFWACQYQPENVYRSEWEAWCEFEGYAAYSEKDEIKFTLRESARVLYIHSKEDYEAIPPQYKAEPFLNWGTLAEDYDAVEVYVHSSARKWFQGWDVDSIVVFRKEAIELL